MRHQEATLAAALARLCVDPRREFWQ